MDILAFFPPWFLPAVLFLTISIIFMDTIRRKRSTFKLPPSPSKLPLIGNLHQVSNKDIHLTLWKLSQKYGQIMHLHFGSKPFVVISSSEMATQILKTHDQQTCTRPDVKGFKRLSYDYLDIAFSPHGDHWRDMRKVLVSDFLGPKRARLLKKVMDVEMEGLFHSLSLGTIVTLDDIFLNLVNDSVSKVTFGKSYRGKMFNGKPVKEIIDGTIAIALGGSFSDVFPSFGWILDELTGWNRKLETSFGDIDGLFQMIIDEHVDGKEARISEEENDLVDDLVSRLTTDELKGILLNVINGAIDTTASALVWAMSEIIKNPRVMEKLQKEIRSQVGSKPKVDESDIINMTYLKMVLKETLRLHPPVPLLLTRVCMTHFQIHGYHILPETQVLINTWAIGRDPRIWKESPTEFIPERFEDLQIEFISRNFEMVPFGGGRRACPGYNSAISTIEFIIANLLYRFDWEIPEGKNEDLDMEEASCVPVRRKTPLCLVPKKYNPQY